MNLVVIVWYFGFVPTRWPIYWVLVRVFNATFINISVLSTGMWQYQVVE